jgi:hypothetical protein
MKRVLIISHNLIGDALCAGVAIREWFRLHRTEYDEVDLLTQNDHVTRLYKGTGVEWTNIFYSMDNDRQIFTKESLPKDHRYIDLVDSFYDKIFVLGAGDAGKYADDHQCHIIEGFCDQLGIESPKVGTLTNSIGTFKAWKPYYDPWVTLAHLKDDVEVDERFVLFSPFSASCASRKGDVPNKMLQPGHWIPLIQFMRTLGLVRMLGAPDDKPDESWQLSEEEVMTGVRLDYLAVLMKNSKLVITVDNGMGHLAASQDAKHILFYPQCLGWHFIFPWGANNTVPIQIEPSQIYASQLMASVRRASRFLGVIE